MSWWCQWRGVPSCEFIHKTDTTSSSGPPYTGQPFLFSGKAACNPDIVLSEQEGGMMNDTVWLNFILPHQGYNGWALLFLAGPFFFYSNVFAIHQ
jgi:hypothetical protein